MKKLASRPTIAEKDQAAAGGQPLDKMSIAARLLLPLAVLLLLLFFYAASVRAQSSDPDAATAGPPQIKALIIHDQIDDPDLANQLANLLGHFPIKTDINQLIYYLPGEIENYDVVFYLGGTHKPMAPAFLDDVNATGKTVVWMGRGLDWLGARHSLSGYGFSYARVDASGALDRVLYKNTTLAKTDPVANLTYITDDSLASVRAWLEGDADRAPYAIASGNFWFFADLPMIGATDQGALMTGERHISIENGAYLVLADLLHDILGVEHAVEHRAMVRIEDIHPNTDLERLESAVDYLYHKGIPFGISLIPVYRNPATGEEVHLSDRPQFVQTIKDAQAKGGAIILHGYSHQREGETAVDYEFWERDTHAPPPNETVEEIQAQIDSAIRETNANGIYPMAWETPHYAASNLVHRLVAGRFGVVWERRDAPFFPYVVSLPGTGQTVLPETLGYINPQEGRKSSSLLNVAANQRVVRDGYAVFFFHPSVVGGELRNMVDGLRDLDYRFISPVEAAGYTYQAPPPPSFVANWLWQANDRVGSLVPQSIVDPGLISGLALFIVFYYWGIFLLSRKPSPPPDAYDPSLTFIIVIPALNEELVIARTLQHLISLPYENLRVLVVNDDSDDRTREIVLHEIESRSLQERVAIIDHPKEQARQGKGAALNYAFQRISGCHVSHCKGSEKIIMGVLDADGRVEPGVIDAVNPYFTTPGTGAVQVGVRISNAGTNILTRWQNFEFLTFARISQKAREHLGSVGLGGNGQFVRLSALATFSPEPWTDALTEDLDLGIRLMLSGWKNHYCPYTFVAQQGVTKLIPLIRQRTRWFQGHATCWRYIPALLISRRGTTLARSDTIYYLLTPMLVFLFMPGSILFLIWSIYFLVTGASDVIVSPLSYLPALLIWYALSFGALPTVVWTFWREEKDMSAFKAFLWAHLFAFFYVIWFVAGVRGIYRMARGEVAWVKTARTEEAAEVGKV